MTCLSQSVTILPAITPEGKLDLWLNPDVNDKSKLLSFFKPCGEMEGYDVSPRVNSPTYNLPECIKPDNASRIDGK